MIAKPEKPRRKFYIAIPVEVNGSVSCHMNAWLLNLPRSFGHGGFYIAQMPGNDVAHVRNRIVRDFLASDADVLWMVDSDMNPSLGDGSFHGGVPYVRDAMDRDDVDVVTGLSFRITPEGPMPVVSSSKGRKHALDFFKGESGLREARGVSAGGACLAIKRNVLEGFLDRKTVWFKTVLEEDDPRRFGDLKCGEDVWFFRKAEELGYRVWVDTRVCWGHMKMLDLRDELNRTEKLLKKAKVLA